MVFATAEFGENDWAGKTWEEVGAVAEQDGSVLIVPVGSLEQHGPHMPTCTDTLLCDAVAHAGAERASDEVPVLIAPPVWTGFSPHHLPVGATVTLGLVTMVHLLEDVANSALENGFDAILFLNGHGGNTALISALPRHLGPSHPDVDVLGLTYWMLLEPYAEAMRDSEVGGFAHAGELETSLVMHLRPELVDEEQIEDRHYETRYDLETQDLVVPGPLASYRSRDPPGTGGDPTLATPEKGAEFFDVLGEELASLLGEIHRYNR